MNEQEPSLRVRRLAAANAPSVRAVLHAGRALQYTAGVDARDGVPAHVRAASAIRRRGSRLIVVQDDVNALAVLDAAGGVVPLLLPTGSGGQRLFEERRGNKHLKMDLEACVVLPDGRLVAFGSGSSPQREQLVIVEPGSSVQVVSAAMLYAGLRQCTETIGAELNIEGAVVQGERLRLFQRGNGGRRPAADSAGSAVLDLSLTATLAWLQGRQDAPAVTGMCEVDLGEIDGAPFGFTDAALTDDGRLAFLACAEDSLDVRQDGTGARVSIRLAGRFLRTGDGCGRVEWTPDHPEARRSRVPGPAPTVCSMSSRDMDRVDEPALIFELRVSE